MFFHDTPDQKQCWCCSAQCADYFVTPRNQMRCWCCSARCADFFFTAYSAGAVHCKTYVTLSVCLPPRLEPSRWQPRPWHTSKHSPGICSCMPADLISLTAIPCSSLQLEILKAMHASMFNEGTMLVKTKKQFASASVHSHGIMTLDGGCIRVWLQQVTKGCTGWTA